MDYKPNMDYKWWKLVLVCVTVVLCLWIVCGCAPVEGMSTANPVSRVTIDPLKGTVKFESSRDDKATLGKLKATLPPDAPSPLAGTTLEVEELDLDASASKVRKANVGQISAMDEFNRGAWEGFSGFVDAAGNSIVGPVMGRLYPNTGAEIAKAAFYAIGVPAAVFGVIVLFLVLLFALGKVWKTLFPSKDPMMAMWSAMMANEQARWQNYSRPKSSRTA